ncbi:squamosa promoter-binding-like protein 7 [Aristolochia californica]|uniref:squamosa promoter-binding-like protein 7 n=1 Tax=Aristolochia californica TaxID=171875 RepID=UPI0035DA9735
MEDLLTTPGDPTSVWDLGSLLDISIDDPSSILSWDTGTPIDDSSVFVAPQLEHWESPSADGGDDRVRKRDPRLTCENFLAGRIPCACPELDEKDEEEEGIGRKRVRTASATATFRCQVPGCEADISELKGYHRRHRVCLNCANASSVVLDGEQKRYCQQCGKFHLLPDFDEGKRSCRRKLERHNNRRRRKSADVKSAVEKELPGNLPADVSCDTEVAKDVETVLASEDEQGSPLSSLPHLHNNSGTSFSVSPKAQKEEGKVNSKSGLSPSICDNKFAYSSMCPTGRLSFKLYDWNPAEFPRRLRHQIFQWLASMPVELEGYIRPGCTILTLFIAMPQFMWKKLQEDGASYLKDLVHSPHSLLSRRGPMHIHLNNMIFQVLNDGTSLMSIKMEIRVPRLHYVHPTFFEAGKPMAFVACGSNLRQSKFRFLVSFAGKYLVHDSCITIHQREISCSDVNVGESSDGSDHEIFRICIPQTEPDLFGPAFIEVENESGLSNFIPVLLGDQQVCSELQFIQQEFDESRCSIRSGSQVREGRKSIMDSCKFLGLRHAKMSELLLDIAWLLKEPQLTETCSPLIQIKRLNRLLNFLIQKNATFVLERVLQSFESMIADEESASSAGTTCGSEMGLLQEHINQARKIIDHRRKHGKNSVVHAENADCQGALLPVSGTRSEMLCDASISEDLEGRRKATWKAPLISVPQEKDLTTPLINKEVMTVNSFAFPWPQNACVQFFSGPITRTRFVLLMMASFGICCGVCVALRHPHKIGEFAVTVRRCLFLDSRS